jgi:CelD/BcsL family acetyltransferase involved in cellulose biosynthesis
VLNDSDMHQNLIALGQRARRFQEFAATDCLSLDLSGGMEQYLANRSRSFRKGIRQMKKIDDIEFVDASAEPPETVFPRIFEIQARSYKSDDEKNIFANPHYESFYRALYDRLYQQQNIRTTFLRIAGREVAYIMGGVSGQIYRGFQMSYDEAFRPHALGNRLQLENIRRIAAEGITHYDLGMHSPYKERWMDKWDIFRGVFIGL